MSMKNAAQYKVIFDTDPGVDDAMALFFAMAHPAIELVGITTTFGNVNVAQASANALYLSRLCGRSIPVAQGADAPLVKAREVPPDNIHGADGLGNLAQRLPLGGKVEASSAAQYIVDMARRYPGEIILVAVGPLGNLANALALEPRLPQLVKQVVVMAGAIDEPGNVSPVAEANVWNDPHAADAVFTAGWDVTMVGLDVTHKVVLRSAYFKALAQGHQHPATEMLAHAVHFYSDFYSGIRPELGHGCFGHDVLAFVYLVAPHLFTTQQGKLRVATEGIANGQTILAKLNIPYPQAGWGDHIPATRVCMQVDAAACLQLIQTTLESDWLATPIIDQHA